MTVINISEDFCYVTTEVKLDCLVNLLKNRTEIALDTETYADKTKGSQASALDPHTAKIRLISINTNKPGELYVIDVLKIGENSEAMQRFLEQLVSPHLLKIVFMLSFDLKMIRSNFGVWLQNTRCARTAMQSLGVSTGFKVSQMRAHTLLALARDYYDIHLDKSQAVSDWSQPELSKEQLAYAAIDVSNFLIDGYHLVESSVCNNWPNGFDSKAVFNLDQDAMISSAYLEYHGMFIDKALLKELIPKADQEMTKYRFNLCKSLGFHLEQSICWNEELNDFVSVDLVPDKIATLLNSSTALVKHMNAVLAKTGVALDNLKAAELELVIKELEIKEETLEEESEGSSEQDGLDMLREEVGFNDYGIELVKCLLQYKKYSKFVSELSKYNKIINPVTTRVHAGFNPVGASTGRMSSSGALNLQQVSSKVSLTVPLSTIVETNLAFGDANYMATARDLFLAPEGYNICVSDFSGQETRIAAAVSGDQEMLLTYFKERDEPYLIHPESGDKYENPFVDLHVAAALTVFPHLQQVEPWQLMKASKTPMADGKIPRQVAKILNFSMIYGAQAQRVSEGIGSSTEEAEHVIKKYFRKFGGLKKWLADMADVSKYQNWVEDCLGRKYFVGESNAKGSLDSAMRKGPNAIVQGIGASMTKMGLKYTEVAYQKINARRKSLNPSALEAQVVAVIHDEVVSYIPGDYTLVDCIEKNGFYTPIYEGDDLSKEYAKAKQDAMQLAMTEILSPLLEKTKWSGQEFPSKAEAMIGRRWSVK